jgi:hypothetical protein
MTDIKQRAREAGRKLFIDMRNEMGSTTRLAQGMEDFALAELGLALSDETIAKVEDAVAAEVEAATKQLREERGIIATQAALLLEERDAARAEMLTVKYAYLDCGIERDALRADLATAATALETIRVNATDNDDCVCQEDAKTARDALAAIRTRNKV